MKENRTEFNTFGQILLLKRIPNNTSVRHVPVVLGRNHRKLFLTYSSFNNDWFYNCVLLKTCNLKIELRMQKPVKK